MGCSVRYIFLIVVFIQVVVMIQREVFDFIGFLWIPILINFLTIVFTILGIFGAFQINTKYILSYLLWQMIWIPWNIFLICLYMDIYPLDHMTNIVLKLDFNSESWWRSQGPGCKHNYNTTLSEPFGVVENCMFNYVHVEILQAGLQCFFALLGVLLGICLKKRKKEESEYLSRKSASRKSAKRMSLYSIEFSSELDRSDNETAPPPMSPKPMTPRRVKRRSVMTRGSTSRHSTSSRRHNNRSSTRSSKRLSQNPVTRLIDQQNAQQQPPPPGCGYDVPLNPALLDSYYSNNNMAYGHTNPTYQQSSSQSLNEPDDFDDLYNNRPASVRSSYSNFHGTRAINYAAKGQYHSHATPQVPQKRMPSRSSLRSKAFLNNGPPAYTSSQHFGNSPGDSETTI